MSCSHAAWERDFAAVDDGKCPLCLSEMLAAARAEVARQTDQHTTVRGQCNRARSVLHVYQETMKRIEDYLEYRYAAEPSARAVRDVVMKHIDELTDELRHGVGDAPESSTRGGDL